MTLAEPTDADLENLIACPQCDALYHARMPQNGAKMVCKRCHHTLIADKRNAYARSIALALTVVVLMVGAVFFPFLGVNVAGFSNKASVIDTALTFLDGGFMVALSVFVIAFIIAVPVIRALLIVYVVAPLMQNRRPARHARRAFRLAEDLRPWSMAEIFIIGVAVALVKVADLAKVEFGPAFWMFALLVVIVVVLDGTLDRWSIWTALDRRS
ncbi:Paraquat-inducible protein A [Rhodobacteraceae bacterium THAF1]|uniref:paraquat-inducible protein A n=1 Tax=Palleronia sp. THAF1 TaxID=2587842 RepID=UPI000F3F0BEF|nr:paraquat-inducible protein A [Palleronia sp. THAF1]QFU09319.1 Paraquat-inducible protein A [Palleronia sp. THAF1]VDC26742.1 Paraquat-inducible protein A [Rhodobacteraceae bacterium THAF1]